MALITSAWLLGSAPEVPATSIDVTANAVTETIVLPASTGYYMWDVTAANSALNQLHDALESHSEITSCSAIIGRDRRPRFTCDLAYTIAGWTDLTFRDVLGFTGTEAFAATTQMPASDSRYLWSPGRCEIPSAPLGSLGVRYHDTARGMSGDLVAVATTNNSGRRNSFRFRRVYSTRVMTASELPGEHAAFWDAVQRRFARFKLYRDVAEEDAVADATATSLTGEVLGPYVWDYPSGEISFAYDREIDNVELFSTVNIPVIVTSEYD